MTREKPNRMYVWSSEALASYGQGTIAVVASSAKEARQLVRANLPYDHLREAILAGIAVRPETRTTLYIWGSD